MLLQFGDEIADARCGHSGGVSVHRNVSSAFRARCSCCVMLWDSFTTFQSNKDDSLTFGTHCKLLVSNSGYKRQIVGSEAQKLVKLNNLSDVVTLNLVTKTINVSVQDVQKMFLLTGLLLKSGTFIRNNLSAQRKFAWQGAKEKSWRNHTNSTRQQLKPVLHCIFWNKLGQARMDPEPGWSKRPD